MLSDANSNYFNMLGFIVKINAHQQHQNQILVPFLNQHSIDKHDNPDQSVHLEVDLYSVAELSPQEKNSGFFIFKVRMAEVYQISLSLRKLKYKTKDQSECYGFDNTLQNKRNFKLFCDSTSVANEILYFYLLSAFGEFIELKAHSRIHAAAFVDKNDRGMLVYGTEGSGKSTLALQALADDRLTVLSDEIAILNSKSTQLEFLNLPLSVFAKQLTSASKDLQVSIKFEHFFQGKVFLHLKNYLKPKTKIFVKQIFVLTEKKTSKIKCQLLLFFGLISGKGLPQMLEYFLRPNSVHKIVQILFFRVLFAIKLLAKADVFNLEKTTDSGDRLGLLHLKINQ